MYMVPFAIYPISREVYKNKIMNKKIGQMQRSTLKQLCSPDEGMPIESAFVLENVYNSDDINTTNPQECYLYVENKHQFIIKDCTKNNYKGTNVNNNDNEDKFELEFEWHPTKYDVWGDVINWKNEYKNLMKCICDKFGLVQNDRLRLRLVGSDNSISSCIKNKIDLQICWGDFKDQDRFKTILVEGNETLQQIADRHIINIDIDINSNYNDYVVSFSCDKSAKVIVNKNDKDKLANEMMKKLVQVMMTDESIFFKTYKIIMNGNYQDSIQDYVRLQNVLQYLIDSDIKKARQTRLRLTVQRADKRFIFSFDDGYQISWMCNMNGNNYNDFNQLKWFLANASHLTCCGFMRRYMHISKMMIDDIAVIVSFYFANKFNDNLPILFDIDHKDNEITVQNNFLKNYNMGCQLEKDNFKQYCNLLRVHNISSNMESIYFGMGMSSVSGCKTVIISPQLQHKKNFTEYFVFKHNNIDDGHKNWNDINITNREKCYKRLFLYLKKITNHDIDDMRSEYPYLPFAVYPMSRQTYTRKILNQKIDKSQIGTLRKLCSPDENLHIDNDNKLDMVYNRYGSMNGQECYLYVENRHYFIINCSNEWEELEWHPRTYQCRDPKNEYENLRRCICDKFHLNNDASLKLKFAHDQDMDNKSLFKDIKYYYDLEIRWRELKYDCKRFGRIFVDGKRT